MQPRKLITGAIVLLAAATFARAPATSVLERVAAKWTATSGADPELSRLLESRAGVERAIAPLVAAFAVAVRPADNQGALTLAAGLTVASLFSKTGLGPPQNFSRFVANGTRFGGTEFAARVGDADTDATAELARRTLSGRRLTILQLGDSHTAADFFTGRVRERLQAIYGTGGAGYIVPGVPHPGVRSALFKDEASDGWNYEALQKSSAISAILSFRLQCRGASRRRRDHPDGARPGRLRQPRCRRFSNSLAAAARRC